MKILPPLRLKKSYYDHVEMMIRRTFFQLCYKPILVAFKETDTYLINDSDPIADALRSGRIVFAGEKFWGEYNSNITKHFRKLGGKYDKSDKTWSLPEIPVSLKAAISDAQIKKEVLQKQILMNLESAINNIDQDILSKNIIPAYERTVEEINQDFLKTVQSISIPPELTPQMVQNIATAWGQNLDLYIKKWTKENILTLREAVATNVYQGERAENLQKMIAENYGVSQRKAKFLARQETSLLMSELRKERYKDAGSHSYKWDGVMDERERPDHKALEGKIFSWDDPPVVDRSTGRRGHPGQDFNCRCVARPII